MDFRDNPLAYAIAMGILAFAILLTTMPDARADADDGEYLGFRLGDRFAVPRHAESRDHITGARVYHLDPGTHPHHVDAISLYVSPSTNTIGSIFGEWYFPNKRAAQTFADRYLVQLEARYPKWQRAGRSLESSEFQLWVNVEHRPVITDYWPSPDDYRVGIALIYAPDSLSRNKWMTMIELEVNKLELTAQQ